MRRRNVKAADEARAQGEDCAATTARYWTRKRAPALRVAKDLWSKSDADLLRAAVDLGEVYGVPLAELFKIMAHPGLGRIVALYCRSSTLYQIRYHIRCFYF